MYFDYAQYKQKGFAPIVTILGIIVIFGAVGGAYYFGQSSTKLPASSSQVPVATSQTPISPTQPIAKTTISPTSAIVDETANWKIYQNEIYKFSLKYPDVYKTDVSEAPDNQTHENVSSLRLLGPVSTVEIFAENNNSGLSLSDWVTKYAKLDTKNAKSITIDNQSGYRFIGNNMGAVYSLVYLKKDKIIYWMQIVPEDNQIFDQIISTFKFTN